MKVKISNKIIDIKVCKSFKERLIGMMFKRKSLDYGLCFKKCSSIHTFFMFQKIDVLMCDKNNKVLYYYKSLKPWKIIFFKKNVYYTYEFSKNILNNIDKIKEIETL